MSRYRRSRSTGSTYFFTVTLADRRSRLLVEEIDRLRSAYRTVADKLPFTTVTICVLPDHLHAVWELPPGDADFSSRWGLIKTGFSRGLNAAFTSPSKLRKREKGIWQRRFWEHEIRDEADLQRHVDYLHYNPVRHGYAARVQDWPHSSFHRFVRAGLLAQDWGGSIAQEQANAFGERS